MHLFRSPLKCITQYCPDPATQNTVTMQPTLPSLSSIPLPLTSLPPPFVSIAYPSHHSLPDPPNRRATSSLAIDLSSHYQELHSRAPALNPQPSDLYRHEYHSHRHD